VPACWPAHAAILLLFYASPLSTVVEVVRSRSSDSLHLPLSVMNIVNGSLWLVYGLAITDYFIAVPNGVGALLGVVYCALICAFPRKRSK
jgi:solute carrier family 50 protein (sugar transporter)